MKSTIQAPSIPDTGFGVVFCTLGWYIDTRTERPDDRELSGRMAARVLRRGQAVATHPVRSRKPALSQAPDDRRRDDRSGLAGAAQQSLREAARQPGGVPLDPRQQSVAAGLPVGR